MSLELLFLGTGTSAGVPMIGCDCPVCQSTDVRDKRDRPSVLIREGIDGASVQSTSAGKMPGAARLAEGVLLPGAGAHPGAGALPGRRQYLIDVTAEYRLAAIAHRINHLDGIFITHAHADHIFGLDDLRRYNAMHGSPLDLYVEAKTFEHLKRIFQYVFEPGKNVNKSFVPQLIAHMVNPYEPVALGSTVWTPIQLMHGKLPIVGYHIRQGNQTIAYCTDVSSIMPKTYPYLEQVDVLVIDALRYRHHPTHMTVDQALAVIDQVKPKKAYLTHIAHEIQHADLEARLPQNVHVAFDGLTVSCA